jgi:hypothetical protein
LRHCSGAQLRLENSRASICCEVVAGWPWRGGSLGLQAAAASGSEGGGCAQLIAGKKVLPAIKQSSLAAPGNSTAVAAHRHRRKGTAASLRLLVQDRRRSTGIGTWLRLCSGSEAELTDNALSHSAGRRRAAMAVRGVVARTSERRPDREDKATAPRGSAAPPHGL